MGIVKGYFNTVNGVFLGMMTATNEATGVASTPRYIEGVCFGEYNTETEEFVPLTNPMIIPTGQIAYFDEDVDAFKQGGSKVTVTGMYEDKGADIVRKGSVQGFSMPQSNVYTADDKGNPIATPVPRSAAPKSNFKEAKHPTRLKVDNLPEINWDKLFS